MFPRKIGLARSLSWPKDLDKAALIVADGALCQIAAALDAADLVTTGCGDTIDLAIAANDAVAAAVATERASASTPVESRHCRAFAFVKLHIIDSQTAGFGNVVVKTRLVPACNTRNGMVSGGLTAGMGQGGQCHCQCRKRGPEILAFIDRYAAFHDQVSHHVDLQVFQCNTEKRTTLGRKDRAVVGTVRGVSSRRFLVFLATTAMNRDRAEMVVNQPAQKIKIATISSTMHWVHELILLFGYFKWGA